MPHFFAHSGRDAKGFSDYQELAVHLRAVADGARGRACSVRLAGLPELAWAAGWLHDLGKYRKGFQLMIRSCPVARGETYHKEAGAALAWAEKNYPLAFVIQGHHGGLRDGSELRQLGKPETCPSGLPVVDEVRPIAEPENDALRAPLPPQPNFDNNKFRFDLFTRVLFGCLVDADWADTSAYERSLGNLAPEPAPPPLEPEVRLRHVLDFIATKTSNTPIGRVRSDILNACLAQADDAPAVFSLTVPTGGGKTLASLAFALKHAAKNGLRRVIYVAPYMTILEQNADVIRAALSVGPHAADVFTHYSLAEPPGGGDEETGPGSPARRAENWDAPVVVTTNVQFFESLFSNQPGRCRKLPNIARSVVILDECQSLPPGLVAPTCGMLRQLVADLGCSVVLCTATQPAFDHDSLKDDERLVAAEIVPESMRQSDANDLFVRLKRVHVTWPERDAAPLSWRDVAGRMKAEPAALCVVNTKKAARAVYDELTQRGLPGVFHLSTGMCPQHRREKLAAINALLKLRAPCYVVSTQLIEAGVDVDFPTVLRELAPLEAVIQAAGRCNREGKLTLGNVIVFRSEEGRLPLDPWYSEGRSVVERFIEAKGDGPQIDDPAAIRDYFSRLYYSRGPSGLDGRSIQLMRQKFQFRSIAEEYRLIDNAGQPVVVAKWESHQAEIDALLAELSVRPRKAIFRALAKFQVNLLPSQQLRAAHLIHEGPAGVTIWDGKYDENAGIVEEMADEFII
jgi:CRISPR-associated endonuclease/helicase Cas3